MRKRAPAFGRNTNQRDEDFQQKTDGRAVRHRGDPAAAPDGREAGDRITLFCFLLTLLVIYVHALNLGTAAGRPIEPVGTAGAWFAAAEAVLSNLIGSVAVPGFFMISAYLFCRDLRPVYLRDGIHGLAAAIAGKWRRRIRSLLLPFLLWNAIYYLIYVLFRGAPLSLPVFLSAVLDYRYNPVFWYMQQLILLTLLAPLCCLFAWNRYLRGLALFAALWLAVNYALLPMQFPFHIVNEDAFAYYLLGAMLGLDEQKTLERCGRRQAFALTAISAVMAALAAGVLLCPKLWEVSAVPLTATVIFRLCTPLSLLYLLTLLRLPQHPLPAFMRINFFVYAVHFLLVRGLNHMLFLIVPAQAEILFVAYLLMPVFCFVICYFLSVILRRELPSLYGLLTGGRY